jgi:hypothetical protein
VAAERALTAHLYERLRGQDPRKPDRAAGLYPPRPGRRGAPAVGLRRGGGVAERLAFSMIFAEFAARSVKPS